MTQATFAQALAASLGQRVWLRMPGLPLRTALGEMSTLLLDGQNAVPTSTALGQEWRFMHLRLSGALADLALADAARTGSARQMLVKIGPGVYW